MAISHIFCARGETRTLKPFGTRFWVMHVYQFHHSGWLHPVAGEGIEPSTKGLWVLCSTTELPCHIFYFLIFKSSALPGQSQMITFVYSQRRPDYRTSFAPALSMLSCGRIDPLSYPAKLICCGGRTRTGDLRVMGPPSCQLLYPAILLFIAYILAFYILAKESDFGKFWAGSKLF